MKIDLWEKFNQYFYIFLLLIINYIIFIVVIRLIDFNYISTKFIKIINFKRHV
jgi:hypothetical protein